MTKIERWDNVRKRYSRIMGVLVACGIKSKFPKMVPLEIEPWEAWIDEVERHSCDLAGFSTLMNVNSDQDGWDLLNRKYKLREIHEAGRPKPGKGGYSYLSSLYSKGGKQEVGKGYPENYTRPLTRSMLLGLAQGLQTGKF